MKILVDTSVWSLVLRRKNKTEHTDALSQLILDGLVVLIGPVMQEVLSGISERIVFDELKEKLMQFDMPQITVNDYQLAAEFFNTCRRNGIQGSHTDFLICAAAHNRNLMIYTTDGDFDHYSKYIPTELYKPQ